MTGPPDDATEITLAGKVHPMARPEYDRGQVPAATRLEEMVLVLKPSPAQQSALDEFTKAQQTPGAPEFHHWLTPTEFGQRFGINDRDLLCGITVMQ